MTRYYEFLQRANEGQYMEEQDWDLGVVAATSARLVQKHKLAWDPEHLLTTDTGLINASSGREASWTAARRWSGRESRAHRSLSGTISGTSWYTPRSRSWTSSIPVR